MEAKKSTISSGRVPILLALLLIGAASLYFVLSSCGTEKGTPLGGEPGPAGGGPGPVTLAGVFTYHNDVTRTGQNLNETVLTLANVNSSTFGRIGFLPTTATGTVDAQPLYVSDLLVAGAAHNVLFVASEDDLVYAFDADNFSPLWQISLLSPGEFTSDNRGCDDDGPQIGITATPVIDPQAGPHGTMFVVAMSRDGSGHYHQRLHALDLATGAEQPGSPVTIQAAQSGRLRERAGLLLQNGVIYLAWGSICDYTPYQGRILGYSESTLRLTSTLNIVPNGSKAGIWMAGGGLAVDSSGFIYFTVGNGTFDTTLNGAGFPMRGDFGNSFIKASITNDSLRIIDYFTMHNTVNESDDDEDLGSGGVLILPDLTDVSGNTVHLALTAGKDGNIYVVNRDSLGKFNATDGGIYQKIDATAGGFGTPAYYNGTVYLWGKSGSLIALPISNAQLAISPSSITATHFAYPGTFPSISANGASDAIVWAVERNSNGIDGVLHAYDANNLATELYNTDQAPAGRDQFAAHAFPTPTIFHGKVYLGTRTGVVVFGLLH